MPSSANPKKGDIVDSGYREISEGIYGIKECIIKSANIESTDDSILLSWCEKGRELHGSQTAYLIKDNLNLLYDTLSPLSEEIILNNLESILGDEGLDYLVISHPEANHAGNTGAILQEYPEAKLVVPDQGSTHALFGISEEDMHVKNGDKVELGKHTIEFIEPDFYDHAMTIYMLETNTNTLFTADFLGFEHMGSDCLKIADELDYSTEGDYNVSKSQLNRFNGKAFVWFRYVDPDKTDQAIDSIINEIDPSSIAPAHGQFIREDALDYLRRMKNVIRDISNGEDYHIHSHQTMTVGNSRPE